MTRIGRIVARGPSVGFVVIVFSIVAFSVFVFWTSRDDWYDHLGRTRDQKHRRAVVSDYAHYLTKIAPRYENQAATVAALRRAHELYAQVGDDEAAHSVQVTLHRVLGSEAASVTTTGIANDGWVTGRRPGVITISNVTERVVVRRLQLGYWKKIRAMPITVTVEDRASGDMETLVFDDAGKREVELEVEPGAERRWTITTDKLFRAEGDNRSLGVHVRVLDPAPDRKLAAQSAVAAKRSRQVVVRGIDPDGWTTGGKPAVVTIRNTTGKEIVRVLKAGYWIHNASMPIEVTVTDRSDGSSERFVFEDGGFSETRLVAPPGEDRVWIVETDKQFRAEGDARLLGVHLEIQKTE